MYKLVLFDLDGTLFDSDPLVVALFGDMFKKYNPTANPTYEHLMSLSGPALKDTMKNEFPHMNTEFMCQEFIRLYPEYVAKYSGIFPHIDEMVTKLQAINIKIGIITNKGHQQVIDTLEKFPVFKKFDVVLSGQDVTNPKPDPEGIYKCQKMFNVQNKNDVLYVGDSKFDYLTAKNAGVNFALVGWSPRKLEEETLVKHRISSFAKFVEEIGFENN